MFCQEKQEINYTNTSDCFFWSGGGEGGGRDLSLHTSPVITMTGGGFLKTKQVNGLVEKVIDRKVRTKQNRGGGKGVLLTNPKPAQLL